jgi:hypothetical protein
MDLKNELYNNNIWQFYKLSQKNKKFRDEGNFGTNTNVGYYCDTIFDEIL